MKNYNVEELEQKVGGKYRLVTLMQKRMRQLRSSVDSSDPSPSYKNLKDIVIQEILEDKITLDVDGTIKYSD